MYNKLFTKILDSSIWLESDTTRLVWLTLLAAMDQDGFCEFASVKNLAHRAVVSLDKCKEAVEILESPDPDSADPDNDGRRIERIPGGWLVINAEKYKELVSRTVAREKARQRVAKHRAKQVGSTKCNADVTHSNVSVTQSYTEADAKTESKTFKGEAKKTRTTKKTKATSIPKNFDLTENMITWGADNGFDVTSLRREREKFTDYARANAKLYKDWEAAFRNWMRNSVTFNRQAPAARNGTDDGKSTTERNLERNLERLRKYASGSADNRQGSGNNSGSNPQDRLAGENR